MKFCDPMLRAHQPFPLKLFSGCESILFWMKKSFCFSTERLRFAACRFSSGYDEVIAFSWEAIWCKLRIDAFVKFLFEICLLWETNLIYVCSANQHQVIMPSRLPKMPSWLKKCSLSQSISSTCHLNDGIFGNSWDNSNRLVVQASGIFSGKR